jgi:Lrp/AsnC family transcriptional regulator for asnA, asnC and gidA
VYETDNVDLQIIDLLMEDGRMPAAEIARRIGKVSERVVRYRIDRMVEDELMRVSAIVNPRRFGFAIVADVVIEAEPAYINEVARRLAEYENVSYVACSIGEMDLSVQVVGHDATEVYNFATGVIGKMPGVRKTTTSIVPIVLKDVYQWRVPRDVNSSKSGGQA